jgi:hypothetical protein
MRLGVGIGWNHVEHEALNEDFHTRGRRIGEGDGASHTLDRVRAYISDLGVTHLSVNTMGAGLSPREHIDAILRMKPALDGV